MVFQVVITLLVIAFLAYTHFFMKDKAREEKLYYIEIIALLFPSFVYLNNTIDFQHQTDELRKIVTTISSQDNHSQYVRLVEIKKEIEFNARVMEASLKGNAKRLLEGKEVSIQPFLTAAYSKGSLPYSLTESKNDVNNLAFLYQEWGFCNQINDRSDRRLFFSSGPLKERVDRTKRSNLTYLKECETLMPVALRAISSLDEKIKKLEPDLKG